MNVALRSDSLNLISLCTGGGGLDLGVELAMPSARSVVLVEREAFAAGQLVSAIQQGLLAEAAIWSDVATFNGRPWRGIVDGVIGGIPCQPHSLAGKRGGSDDERDLWSDARRIIVRSGAWFVLIENVSGMLSAKPGLDPGALRVRRDLQRLGFDVEGGLFTASEVGASHERERVFILAVADTERPEWRARGVASDRSRGTHPEFAGSGSGLPGELANPRCQRDERWGGSGDILCPSGQGEGQRDQREWHGDAVDDCGDDLAHADSERLEGLGADAGAQGWPDARGSAGLRHGTALEHAEGERRREGRPEPVIHDGSDPAASSTGGAVAHTDIIELRRKPSAGKQLQLQRDDALGLFAPGPSDLSRWRHTLERAPELEPAFRRVANGLASRLDVARVDRLRMLGNGVVPLEAAYAVRTLLTRLAASGSAGATRLIRMMALSVSSHHQTPEAT